MCEERLALFAAEVMQSRPIALAIAVAMTLVMAVWREGAMQRRFVARDLVVVSYTGGF